MSDPEKGLPDTSTTHHVFDSVTSTEHPDTAKEMEITDAKDDVISIAPSHASTISEHEDEEEARPKPNPPATLSRTMSVIPEAVIVDRQNRRGMFAGLTLIPEVENPYHYTRKTKWYSKFLNLFACFKVNISFS